MKTLEEIKEEYFKNLGHKDLDHAVVDIAIGCSKIMSAHKLEKHFSNISELYATEYAKEALRLASANAKTEHGYFSDGSTSPVRVVDKQSILSEKNLPSHS